jgi:hypothetical protein
MNGVYTKGFYAYPSSPGTIGEAVRNALQTINSSGVVTIKSWEDCSVGGKLVIQEICNEIEASQFFCADLTGINANVMFELGYAIARNKRIWLTLDTSLVNVRKEFDQLRILTTVGYQASTNSGLIVNGFYKDSPYQDLDATVFDSYVRPNLTSDSRPFFVYLKGRHPTEASVRMSERVDKVPLPLIVDDPNESAVQTLVWYGTKLFSSAAVLCHLEGAVREDSKIQIARRALAAGMAYGFDKPLLMLSEGNFLAPLDYRDLLHNYQTASEAKKFLEMWLEPLEHKWKRDLEEQRSYISKVKLATELKSLRLGEYVAENEADNLSDYFVETAAYRAALEGKQSIFVGRKGSGKSANFLALAKELQSDARNLVCVIKPVAYELEGVVSLLSRYKEKDEKNYAVESLWKFLLITEIANTVGRAVEERPGKAASDDEQQLLALLNAKAGFLRKDFSIRLEECVEALNYKVSKLKGDDRRREESRLAISEAIHENVMGELRRVLGRVLRGRKRVAVLMDNLDKAWDKQTDINTFSNLLLGLLAAASRLTNDFHRSANKLDPVNLSLAIFLRSDIFYHVMAAAREPDKIDHTVLVWQDDELLLRVLEERFVRSHDSSVSPKEMWDKYFCATVGGTSTPMYFLDRILKRPRDLLYFVKAAMEVAVNRGHGRVEESDIVEAERQYSQFALSSVVVENVVSLPNIETILYEFVGLPSILSLKDVHNCMNRAKVEEQAVNQILAELCMANFFGVEVDRGTFRFPEDSNELRKLEVLSTRFRDQSDCETRYMINKPFWAFLEIQKVH